MPLASLLRRLSVASMLVAGSLASAQAPQAAPRTLTIFATSDEHGWLEPLQQRKGDTFQGGMAHFYSQLLMKEGYRPQSALLLSSGDMWTGPYESTVLQGRPMVQVMNSMAYDAAAIGNHDFDFGLETLARRAGETTFPLLAANLYQAGTRTLPPFARPFALTTVDGVQVGVVGLITLETPYTTDARNVQGLEFGAYEEALRRAVPAARAAGAQVVIVTAHAPLAELRPLVPLLRELGVSIALGGHRHVGELEVAEGAPGAADDVLLCNPGAYARSYCKVQVNIDGANRSVGQRGSIEMVAGNIKSPTYPPHAGLMGVIAEARGQAEVRGAEVLADVPGGLARGEGVHTMGYLVVDSWLQAVPQADFAITNQGGFRQDVEPGQVRMRDVIGAMPFDNYLVVVELTGAQVLEALLNPQSLPGGLTVEVGVDAAGNRTITRALDRSGQPVDPAKKYKVVINDFMYRGGDRYRFREFDPDPEETALHWREPVIRLLRGYGQAGQPVPVATQPRFVVR